MMRSPLKTKPLRNPGESLSLQIQELIEQHALVYAQASFFMLAITAWEWYRAMSDIPPRPWAMTFVTVILMTFTAYKFISARRQLRHLKQGLDGEKYVGQYLDQLSLPGLRVLHDIPGPFFNLDHVAVAPSGIFVIETKTPSKPLKGQPIVTYDGTSISVNGYRTEAPLIQVRAAASWLKDMLKYGTGKEFTIQCVVVYPDWYVKETAPPRRGAIRVVNQQFLPGLLGSNHVILADHEIAMAADHIARHVRNTPVQT